MSTYTLCAVLPALPASAPAEFTSLPGSLTLTIGSHAGDNDRYTNWHSQAGLQADGHGYWGKFMTRKDAQGRSWSCVDGDFVMDDFGFLVRVTPRKAVLPETFS